MKKIGLCLFAVALLLVCVLTSCSGGDKETTAPISGGESSTAYRDDQTGETFLYSAYTSDSVEIIGYSGSDAFHKVTVPSEIDGKTVSRIGNEAFKDNNAITGITLPDTVTEIGGYAFAGCDYLTEIHLSSALTGIGECAFYQSGLTSVSLPATLTTLGKNAFYECGNLTAVSFAGNNLKEIPSAAFYKCEKLETVTFPAGLETIGDYAFYQCTALAAVTLPDSVSAVGKYAFTHTAADDNGSVSYPENWK